MSDPYGHGETCDCERCMAYSEGLEARRRPSGVPRTGPRLDRLKRLPSLQRTTAHMRETYDGLVRSLPPSGVAYLVGFLHGMFEDELAEYHLHVLDSLCRLVPAHDDRQPSAHTQIVRYLREAGIADYRPRMKFMRTPEDP